MSGDGDRLDQLDYYTLLQVDRDASEAELRRAFRRFARKYHPDRFAGQPKKVARANQIYRRGSEALKVLLDPVARRAYDEGVARGELRLDAERRARAQGAHRRANAGPRARRGSVRALKVPQARLLYEEAARDWKAGRAREAWRKLRAALDLDPHNDFLKRQLAKVDAYLRR